MSLFQELDSGRTHKSCAVLLAFPMTGTTSLWRVFRVWTMCSETGCANLSVTVRKTLPITDI